MGTISVSINCIVLNGNEIIHLGPCTFTWREQNILYCKMSVCPAGKLKGKRRLLLAYIPVWIGCRWLRECLLHLVIQGPRPVVCSCLQLVISKASRVLRVPACTRQEKSLAEGVWEVVRVLSGSNDVPIVENIVTRMLMLTCKETWVMWCSHALGKGRKFLRRELAVSRDVSESTLLASSIIFLHN